MEGGYRMSREIDERIVAMYFDNRNFEKGAQQTIQTLDELKKGMNFEGLSKGSKSFTDLSKKLNLEKVQKSADKLKTTFGGVGDAIKKAFSLGPIDNVFHALDNFKNKYFDRVLGFDIAQKLASSLENTFRNLTIAPISAGWSQYENTMDSVKTIMSSTGESIDTVKAKLNEMTEYANKTIYSLNDMTSNLGKFTNNGVKLDDATNAMIGLANAAADAGQGAQQASMAMYNVSQAIGVGKMLSIDWKSLENANIATVKLKQTLIDSAVAAGTLDKKMVKNAKTGKEEVQYWTKAEKGAKAAQVTVEGFRDSLSKGWLDKQALLNTFAIYSGQLNATEIAALGYSREESERLAKIGEEAMKAAQEVRTFSKMMDALREGVQSTWATSFEYIFGDMQEGTNLWTKLNKLIEDTLTKGAENRNNILMSWRGMAKDENGNVRNIQKMYDAEMELAKKVLEDRKASIHDTPVTIGGRKATAEEIAAAQKAAAEAIQKAEEQYAATVEKINKKFEKYGDPSTWVDYRDVAINALLGVEDAEGNLIKRGLFQDIQEIAKTVKDAFSDVFGVFDDQSLINITKGLSEFADKFTAWLGDASDSESRLSKIRSGLTGVFNVLKIGYEVFKSLVSVGIESIKPLIDPLLNLFSKFGKWLNLKDAKNLSDIIKTLSDRFDKLWKKLTTLGWSGIFDKIGNWMKDLGRKVRDSISTWLDENGLGDVTKWFVDIGDKIKEGYETVKKWWNESAIGKFFKGIVDSITGVFATKDAEGNDIEMPIVSFFRTIKTDIDSAFAEVQQWWEKSGIPQFFIDMWNSVVGLFQPVKVEGKMGNSWYEDSPIVSFFKNLWRDVDAAFEEVKIWWEGSGIPQFFTDMWDAIVGFFQPVKVEGKMGNSWYEDSPIVSFFKSLGGYVDSAFSEVKIWWEGSGIPQFFNDMWNSIVGLFNPVKVEGKMGNSWYEDSPIVSFFKGIAGSVGAAFTEVETWWNDSGIPEFFQGIWDGVMKAFDGFGTDEKSGAKSDKKAPIVEFFENLSSDLKKIWDGIVGWEGWESVGKFFSDIWGWIIGLFKGDESVVAGTEDVAVAIKDGEKKAEALEKSKGLFEQIGEFFGQIFTSLSESVSAIGNVPEARAIMETISDIVKIVLAGVQTIVDWLGRITGTSEDKMTGWDVLIPVVGAVIAGLLEIAKYKKASNLAKIAEAGGIMTNIGGEILKIAAAMALIAVAIRYLGMMKPEELALGGGAILAIGGIIISMIKNMKKLNETLNAGQEPEKAWERVVGKLISWAGMAGMLWILVEKLPNIIEALSKAKEQSGILGSDVRDTLMGLVLAVGGMALALALLEKIAPKGLSPVAALKSIVTVLGGLLLTATVLLGAGGLLELIGENPEDIKDKMGRVTAFLEGLGDAINGLFRGLFGVTHFENVRDAQQEKNIENTKRLLQDLMGMTDSVEESRLVTLIRLMETLTDMTKIGGDINTDSLYKLSESTQYVVKAVSNLTKLFAGGTIVDWKADNVVEEIESLKDTKQFQRISDGIGLIRNFFGALSEGAPMANMSHYARDSWFSSLADGEYVDMIISGINNVIEKAGGLKDASGIQFDGFAIVKRFYESVAEVWNTSYGNPDLPKFDGTPIVNAILDSLLVGDEAIKNAVKAMVQDGMKLLGQETKDGTLLEVPDIFTAEGGVDMGKWFTMPDTTGMSKEIEKAIDEYTDDLETKVGQSADKMGEGFNLKIGGIDLTDSNGDGIPDVIDNIRKELEGLQSTLDTDDTLTLSIRPVLDTKDFGTEISTLQSLISSGLPVGINGTVSFGGQQIPINDTNIVTELQLLRTEVANARLFIQSAVNNMGLSVGNKITGLGSDIRQMKFYLDTKVLVGGILGGVDQGLGNRANLFGSTGVLPVRVP